MSASHEPGGARQLLGPHRGGDAGELVGADPQRHDDLLERGVAGALPEAVDTHLDLAGSGLDSGQRVGRGEPEVVVAVSREHVVAGDLLADVLDQGAEVPRDAVPDGVGDVQRGGAGLDRGPEHLEHEVERRPGRVLGAELHVVGVLPGAGHATAGLGQHLGLVHLQHVLHVLGARRDEHVDAGPGRVAQRVPAAVDVGELGPRQTADGRGVGGIADRPGDCLDGFEVSLAGDREPGLDVVDPGPGQLFCDLELLGDVERDARRLLSVTKGRVEHDEVPRVSAAGQLSLSLTLCLCHRMSSLSCSVFLLLCVSVAL